MRKVSLNLFLVLSIIFFLSECQRREKFEYSGNEGGMLIIALRDEPSNLNPIYPAISGLSPVTHQLFSPLISERSSGKVRPALAESWIYSEDLKSITYTIRKGAVWHDGEPVTSEDVVFTVEQILRKENNSPLTQKLNYIESVEALGPRRVRFNLKQVYAGELQSTNIYPIPKHILEGVDSLRVDEFNTDPVGSGPFELKEWNRGNWIELVANPDYFRGEPPLDRMVFYFPSTMEELLSELSVGNVDLAYDMPPADYDTLTSYNRVLSPGRSYTYLGWNLERFSDEKLRHAFSMAINREEIISDVLQDYAQIINGPITPEHWAYNPDLKQISEDKEEARKIIEELGYSRRRGYYRELDVEILVEEGNETRRGVAEKIVSDLRDIGVRATSVTLSGSELIKRLFNKDFDAYILGWSVEKEFNPFQIWGSNGIYNFVGYKNPKVDSLIGEALLSLDRERAKKALYEFQEIVADDLPYTFLYEPKKITLVNKKIQGISQNDRRPLLSFVDELWFREVPASSIELASLGENYRETSEEEEETRGEEETSRAEEVLQVSAPTEVPEQRTTTTSGGEEESTVEDTSAGTEEEAAPPKFVPYEVPPKPLNLDEITFPYPEVAERLGLSGTVYLELWIDTLGNVNNVVLAKSLHPILDKVAMENAGKLKFSPAKQGDKPVAVRYSFPVRFE